MKLALALVACLLAAPALASREQIHRWKAATITVSTDKFGDVEARATANDDGNVKTLALVIKGKTITVPEKWIAKLPAMPLASLEIRTEPGSLRSSPGPAEPWLYLVFRNGAKDAATTVQLHLAFQKGKLDHASSTTFDGKGGSKNATIAAP
jgi:hypothetical protein